MNVFTAPFKFHVDPMHFNFQWSEPLFIDVEYSGFVADGVAKVAITKVSAPPYLISSIVIHSNWLAVCAEIEEAAKHNALEVSGSDHVDETILSAIAPFITTV